ncbi:FxsB family cyclophane-forming radical SAM/SPASM peptide maturase [Streptomyces sp. R-07]|uniref:FxsB family cyclophane-forming radical SAM/SPASM peptide maturase n=1 Tax=Streptomyces sp. R-07 TaxID=3404052 RepID=UPI003CF60B92
MSERSRPPLPFREFLVKVHSRCNLACRYCYVYESADRGWRAQPLGMAPETARLACLRIAEHARRHALRSVRVILHGGEPLLAGTEFLARFVRGLRAALPAATRAEVALQTNGTLLDETVLRFCHAEDIRIGVSLDGPPVVHDRYRRDPAGRGSHARVAASLELLARPEHRPLWAGLLTTVDPSTDPLATYDHLLSYDPPALMLILPLGNWTVPPPGRVPDPALTPYADWLIPVFDRWYGSTGRAPRITFFESVIDLLLGGDSASETIGGAPSRLAVIDTDGSLTLSDHLKTTYDGADRTGLDVHHDPLDALLDHPGVAARQAGPAGLCAGCRACPLVAVCGGGHYPHRYRAGSGGAGHDNPSVYCPDLARFIGHVARSVAADLPATGAKAGRAAADPAKDGPATGDQGADGRATDDLATVDRGAGHGG